MAHYQLSVVLQRVQLWRSFVHYQNRTFIQECCEALTAWFWRISVASKDGIKTASCEVLVHSGAKSPHDLTTNQ